MEDFELEIAEVIESGLYPRFEIEGELEILKKKHFTLYYCPKVKVLNTVGHCNIPLDEVDSIIDEVIDFYKRKNINKFRWYITPSTEPKNLNEKLIERDFVEEVKVLGMYRSTGIDFDFEITPEFDFSEYDNEGWYKLTEDIQVYIDFADVYSYYGEIDPKGYQEGDRKATKLAIQRGDKGYVILAREKVNNKIVGIGGLSYNFSDKCANLGGAATHRDYCKKGIYSSILKIRAERAAKDGFEYLTTQAKENTSAPILRKFGFKEICQFEEYVYTFGEES